MNFFSSGDDDKKKESKRKPKEPKQEGGGDEPAKPDDKPASEGDKQVCTMKRGDYMIHIMVEQAKNLLVEAGDTIDPMVEITCLGEKKYSTAKEDIDNAGVATWNEHLFFEPKNMPADKME